MNEPEACPASVNMPTACVENHLEADTRHRGTGLWSSSAPGTGERAARFVITKDSHGGLSGCPSIEHKLTMEHYTPLEKESLHV